MSGSYIATTTEDDVQWLMAAGQSLGLSVAQLRHHLAQSLSPAHGALLAEPVEDQAGRATDWYGAGEGVAAPLDQLPPGPRAAMTNRVWALLRDIKAEGVRLGASADTDERVLGAMLERVSHVPDASCVRVRGEAPVVVAWAHGRAGVSVDLSALFKPVEVPLPPPASAAPPPAARRSWLGWLAPALMLAAVALAVLWRQSQQGESAAIPPARPDAVAEAPAPPTPARRDTAQVTAPPSFATPAPPPPNPAEPGSTSETRTPQAPTQARPDTTQVTAPPSFATPALPPPKPAEPGSTRETRTSQGQTAVTPLPPKPAASGSTSETRTSQAQSAVTPLPAPPSPATPPPPKPVESGSASETRTSQAQTAVIAPPAETPPVMPERQPQADPRPAAAPLDMARTDTPPPPEPASPQPDAAQLPPHESEPSPSPRPFTVAAVRNHDLRMLQGCWTVQGGFATAEIQTHKAARVSNWRTCFGPAAAGAASLSGTQLLGWEDGKSCTGAITARFLPDDRLEIADASDCLGDRTLFRMTEQCTRQDDASMLCSWTAHDRSGGAEFRGDGLTLTPGR